MRFSTMIVFRAVFLAAWVFLVLFSPSTLFASTTTKIEGRVFTEQGPMSGATVTVYADFTDIPQQKALLVSNPTSDDGLFNLAVPPGRYCFTAHGTFQGREYFAFHGGNPVSIQNTNAWFGLMALPVKKPQHTEGTGVLKGVVTFKGTPVNKGFLSVYQLSAPTFKGLGFKTVSLTKDGTFSLPLPPGNYVITAKMLSHSDSLSPPQQGDLIGYLPSNPLKIQPDKDVSIEVPCYPKGDRSAFNDSPIIKDNNFTVARDLASSAGNGLKGMVSDVHGKPVTGIFVLAYKTKETVFQMYHMSHGTPFSARTDDQGNFFIPLEEPGSYYLIARDTLGNGPHRGEIYGLYQDNPMHSITFERGQLIEGINIVAGITMGELPQNKIKPQTPIRYVNPEILEDTTISRDTIWSGKVLIKGVVSVKRGSTLTIEPGTTIRFQRLDRDGNGIGDSEILVEGRIVAEGEAEKKITFTSAETEPVARDWSYINVLATGEDNIFRHCIFEYGFSGMQIHTSNTRIFDCLFHRNGEGLHFNTANLEAEYNSIINNGVGIKFSRLEGRVVIKNNTITQNDIGIQFVHQHINAVDFDNVHKFFEIPIFIANNIYSNRKYSFSMGELQTYDINIPGNWWGSAIPDEISLQIFDKNNDEDLGQVKFTPALTAPVSGTGVRETCPEQSTL